MCCWQSAPALTTRVTGEIKHFCPKSKIIHIDIDPASISKNVRVHVPSSATLAKSCGSYSTTSGRN